MVFKKDKVEDMNEILKGVDECGRSVYFKDVIFKTGGGSSVLRFSSPYKEKLENIKSKSEALNDDTILCTFKFLSRITPVTEDNIDIDIKE